MKPTFAQQFRKARDNAGLTQARASELVGYTKSSIEKWERGVSSPKPIIQAAVLAKLKAGCQTTRSPRNGWRCRGSSG